MMPLAKTQPQFGKGLIVSEKITFEMPCTEGVRKIAARFGVNPGTVQRISRPFEGASVAVA
jgi:hypothetical protein